MQTNDLNEVTIKVPFQQNYKNSDCQTWVTLMEQFLSSNYKDYQVIVKHDHYERITDLTIKFANIEDATFFKLTKYK